MGRYRACGVLALMQVRTMILSLGTSWQFGWMDVDLMIWFEFRNMGVEHACIEVGVEAFSEYIMVRPDDERSCKWIQRRGTFPVAKVREKSSSTSSTLDRSASLGIFHLQAESRI